MDPDHKHRLQQLRPRVAVLHRSYMPTQSAHTCSCQSETPLRSCNNHAPWSATQLPPSEAAAAAAAAAGEQTKPQATKFQAAQSQAAQFQEAQSQATEPQTGHQQRHASSEAQLCQLAGLPLVRPDPRKDVSCLLSCLSCLVSKWYQRFGCYS